MITPLEQVIGYGILIAAIVLYGIVCAALGLNWLERRR